MPRNIELKANCSNHIAAQQVAQSCSGQPISLETQRDTYFRATNGRLKMRERRAGHFGGPWEIPAPNTLATAGATDPPAQLIWYRRDDDPTPRPSDYSLMPIDSPSELRRILIASLGVVAEVVKHRTVYLLNNVRIHLDQVRDLGSFVEFEAIVDTSCDDTTARRKLDHLLEAFRITSDQILSDSYCDLIQRARRLAEAK